jgi:hypothetical protein
MRTSDTVVQWQPDLWVGAAGLLMTKEVAEWAIRAVVGKGE